MLSARLALLAIGLFIFGAAAATAQSAATGDFSGAVDVGGRKLHLECKGAGAPVVILISGYRNNAEIWTVEPGPGLTPVFEAVSRFTRVSAYDRPGTILDADHLSRSDPVPMPRTTDAIVAELHATLDAAGIDGPYILAAHSLGGLFARLYAATYPEDIAGLVLVDAWQEDLDSILGPEQWAAYVEVSKPAPPGLEGYADLESVNFGAASAGMREAAKSSPLGPIPLYVISRAKPVQLPPGAAATFSPEAFEAAWREGQRRLATLLPDARHQIAAESDHYVQIEQPALVTDAIRAVVDAVRDPASWTADFAGLVDIGGGRRMYLECRGTGSPTVLLISGKGNGAADWNEVLDPADPAHDAQYDLVGAGQGSLHESDSAVLPAVSRFTRACAYDRPGTRIDGDDISTPVAQPHRLDQAVNDLSTLLAAAGETGPYVLVPHSYGGFVAMLYARTHPDEVAGLVMVDAGTELIQQVVSTEAMAGWDVSNRLSTPQAPEAVELLDAFEKINAAPPLPERPAIVLSADKPAQQAETAGSAMVTFADWLAAQDLLAASVDARHVTRTRSGHNIYLYEPQLVVDAVRDVVDAVRAGKTRLDD